MCVCIASARESSSHNFQGGRTKTEKAVWHILHGENRIHFTTSGQIRTLRCKLRGIREKGKRENKVKSQASVSIYRLFFFGVRVASKKTVRGWDVSWKREDGVCSPGFDGLWAGCAVAAYLSRNVSSLCQFKYSYTEIAAKSLEYCGLH